MCQSRTVGDQASEIPGNATLLPISISDRVQSIATANFLLGGCLGLVFEASPLGGFC